MDGRPVCLGRVTRAHGLRGEIRIQPHSGDPGVFTSLERLAFGPGLVPDFQIESARTHKGQAIVKLAGVDRREQAEPLRNCEVWVSRSALPPPEAGSYYWVDLQGCRVVGVRGETLGEVTKVAETPAHVLLVLRTPGGQERMLPFIEPIVRSVDLVARRIDVAPPPGLLEAHEGNQE